MGASRLRWRPETVVLAVAVVLGALLRFPGTRWGLPARLHPDEFVIVDGALDLIHRHSFEPSFYFRPDHVEIQLSSIAYTIYSHLVLHSPVEAAYAVHPGRFLLISRCITVLFGLAMIVLAYFVGRRLHPVVGAVGAVLFAVFPPFVENSQYATPDIPMATMFMVVILACMIYLTRPGLGSLLVASAATSVGIAIKYPAAIAAIMIAIVVVVAAVRDRAFARILTHGVTAIVAVVGFLFVISPVLFTNFGAVRASLANESGADRPGADGLSWFGNMRFYLDDYVLLGGAILAALTVLGIVVAIRLRLSQAIPLVLGAILWVLLSILPLHWPRWGVPMYVTPLMFSSIGVHRAAIWVRGQALQRRWLGPAGAAIAALVVVNMLVNSIPVLSRGFVPDDRLRARAVLADRGITAKNTAFDGYTPMQPGAPKDLLQQMDLTGDVVAPQGRQKYIAVSDCMYRRYLVQPAGSPQRKMYERIFHELPRVYHVTPVETWKQSPFEPLNILRSHGTISEYLDGKAGGCRLSVYRAPA